ncbi:hypothetical protein E3O56_14090 [Pseudomonas sp. W2Aug9]|uniref:Uncharacterized protein n=1 Tax=Pseudomonas synxantha TaxID=47883 RepID=A0A5D3GES4_9PSED|nr:hypothetical protein [Pseudomonas sp. W2Aug9]MCK3829687.1 hypothetical protein [Pseudomonas fluorescens]MCK3840735.1 hypothetical protein [Pseudomonas sp. NCIMB 10586]MCK3843452.1 hypothetical protein [Pseudomonas sp. W15Feb34]MCK3862041.1 hypothetical protein [Pseudomonas sp. B329]TYK58218.1 hypothetical protein FXO26_09375 [Pseudomonas synxantha]
MGGSWLACDAATSVCQLNRGDAIAGKPGSHIRPGSHRGDVSGLEVSDRPGRRCALPRSPAALYRCPSGESRH